MNIFSYTAIIIFVYMTAWHVVSLIVRRADVADVAWGLGFIMVAWESYLQNFSFTSLLIAGLVTIWGLRLAIHIYTRNRHKPEDARYAAWRQEWGRTFVWRSYLQVFLLQGFFMWLISLPIMAVAVSPNLNFSLISYFGIAVWLFGFYFESTGDKQLANFIHDPSSHGHLMTTGLWRYTRHPNYFGEVTQWWGVWIISLGAAATWWSVVGPLTITFLILKVSGVPMLEKKYVGRPDWEEYKKKTSVFFPLPPKK